MERNELQSLDANFRASNYLSVAQLFLNSNVDIEFCNFVVMIVCETRGVGAINEWYR